MNIDELRKVAEEQMEKFEETGEKEGFISFDFEGTDIINPFVDETGRFEVNPEEYYGESFLNSDWQLKDEAKNKVSEIKKRTEDIINNEEEEYFAVMSMFKESSDPRYHFRKRLKMLVDAATTLSKVWEDLDDEYNEMVKENYPFERDFSEIVADLVEWKEKINK